MIKIEQLSHHMHHIPTLIDIWCDVLGNVWIPEVSRTQVSSWMYAWEHTDNMPTAHIALDGKKPVGICALQKNDGIRPDLWPWLSDLCVAKPYQGQKVGERLIEATKKKAKEFGFLNLYLFTFGETLPLYYTRLGWQVIGLDKHRNLPVTVMTTDL